MNDTRYIPLTSGAVARIDARDYALVSGFKWRLTSEGYAARRIRGGKVYLHRFIIGPALGQDVDHASGDKLDNRRANLRLCSARENQANSRRRRWEQYKGVTRQGARFRARLGQQHIGMFDTAGDAAMAYDRAAVKQFGQFARVNFPWLVSA